jgi:hypothetical protein
MPIRKLSGEFRLLSGKEGEARDRNAGARIERNLGSEKQIALGHECQGLEGVQLISSQPDSPGANELGGVSRIGLLQGDESLSVNLELRPNGTTPEVPLS